MAARQSHMIGREKVRRLEDQNICAKGRGDLPSDP